MFQNGVMQGCGGTALENVGGTAFVNEMLLQSHEGFLRICPSLPEGIGASFRLRAEGGFIVSATCDGSTMVSALKITAPLKAPATLPPSECQVRCPWHVDAVQLQIHGSARRIIVDSDGMFRFGILPGQVYELTPSWETAQFI